MPGEYHGFLSKCFNCKRKFRENDPVAVVPLGMIFCVPIYGNEKDCIISWTKKRKISDYPFEVQDFKGGRKEDDGHDIEMV